MISKFSKRVLGNRIFGIHSIKFELNSFNFFLIIPKLVKVPGGGKIECPPAPPLAPACLGAMKNRKHRCVQCFLNGIMNSEQLHVHSNTIRTRLSNLKIIFMNLIRVFKKNAFKKSKSVFNLALKHAHTMMSTVKNSNLANFRSFLNLFWWCFNICGQIYRYHFMNSC